MRKITYLSEINEHGYVGYQFEDSKRFASAKVKEDSKGKYFVSKKEKFYLDEVYQQNKKEDYSMKRDTTVNCPNCDELTKHELIVETAVCEEWKCKECGNTRLFGK